MHGYTLVRRCDVLSIATATEKKGGTLFVEATQMLERSKEQSNIAEQLGKISISSLSPESDWNWLRFLEDLPQAEHAVSRRRRCGVS